jgi:hypothetical protein
LATVAVAQNCKTNSVKSIQAKSVSHATCECRRKRERDLSRCRAAWCTGYSKRPPAVYKDSRVPRSMSRRTDFRTHARLREPNRPFGTGTAISLPTHAAKPRWINEKYS